MNDDKIKSQTIKPIAGNSIPTSEDHPLHILDNQTDPSKKPRKFDVSQKPMRTFEKDMEEEMARLEAAGTPIKKQKNSFFSFKKKEKTIPKPNNTTEATKPVKEKFVPKEKLPFYVDKTVLNKKVVSNDEYKINNLDTIDLKKIGSTTQKTIRTFEKDKEEALSHLEGKDIKSSTTPNIPSENEVHEIPKVSESINIVARQIKQQNNTETEKVETIDKVKLVEKPVKTFEEAVAESQARLKQSGISISAEVEQTNQPIRPLQSTESIQAPEPIIKSEYINKPQEKFRTYEGDIADNVKNGKSSVLSMAVAENVRRIDEERDASNIQVESHFGRNMAMVLGSLLLIASGIGGGYYLYSISPVAKVPVVQKNEIVSIIKPDKQIVSTTNATYKIDFNKFISEQYEANKPNEGEVIELILNQKLASSTEKITGQGFITKTGFNTTDTLKRSIQDRWMIGTYTTNDTLQKFVILKTDFFQNAFAGMLKWERTMPNELIDIFNYPESMVIGNFKDKVIMNRDIREYTSLKGEPLFLYTFIDKDTILITTSESVIPEILNRIEKQTYVR